MTRPHETRRAALVQLAPGDGPGVVALFPGLEGQAAAFTHLAAAWAHPWPLLAMQPRGVADDAAPLDCIEAMVAEWLPALEPWSRRGPCLLVGWSFGGLLAYEAAWRLHRDHRPVCAVLLDTRALLPGPAQAPAVAAPSPVRAHQRALERYQPPRGHFPLHILRAQQPLAPEDLGWRAHCDSPTLHLFAGDHHSFTSAQGAPALAAALARILAEVPL